MFPSIIATAHVILVWKQRLIIDSAMLAIYSAHAKASKKRILNVQRQFPNTKHPRREVVTIKELGNIYKVFLDLQKVIKTYLKLFTIFTFLPFFVPFTN